MAHTVAVDIDQFFESWPHGASAEARVTTGPSDGVLLRRRRSAVLAVVESHRQKDWRFWDVAPNISFERESELLRRVHLGDDVEILAALGLPESSYDPIVVLTASRLYAKTSEILTVRYEDLERFEVVTEVLRSLSEYGSTTAFSEKTEPVLKHLFEELADCASNYPLTPKTSTR